jgi:hypothetical protein
MGGTKVRFDLRASHSRGLGTPPSFLLDSGSIPTGLRLQHHLMRHAVVRRAVIGTLRHFSI